MCNLPFKVCHTFYRIKAVRNKGLKKQFIVNIFACLMEKLQLMECYK